MASVPRGNSAYPSGPFRSREGLSSRSNPQSEQLHLRVDPINGDLDEEIDGLHHKVSQLKNIAQEIESEARFQNGFLSQLVPGLMGFCSAKVAQDLHSPLPFFGMPFGWGRREQERKPQWMA